MSQFISYAQNYEDVMLWRALGHVRQGYYVDVGANDPKFDSVTYAFYQRGWRGINIEPMQTFFDALERERPGDINLRCAVGALEGQITFYEVPETGISSAVREAVMENKYLPGHEVIESSVPVTTLNKIFAEYVHSDIHFLKIDVEGYERAVVDGLDLRRWRPWVLVVEATIPNSSSINPEFPHDLITTSGYQFVYFDGLNRYFVSEEHADLREAFSVPPNVFDYFTPRSLEAEREKIEELRAQMASLQGYADGLRGHAEGLQRQIEAKEAHAESLRQAIEGKEAELQWMRNTVSFFHEEVDRARTALAAAQAETAEIRAQYVNILYSQSYRITAPLRAFYRLLSSLRTRFRPAPLAVIEQPAHELGDGISELATDQEYYLRFFQRNLKKRKTIKSAGLR